MIPATLNSGLICASGGLFHLKRSGKFPKVTPSVYTRAWDGRRHVCLHHPCPLPRRCDPASWDNEKAQPPEVALWCPSHIPSPFFDLFPCLYCPSPVFLSPSTSSFKEWVFFGLSSLSQALVSVSAREMITVSDEQPLCTSAIWKFAFCFQMENPPG